MNYNKYIEAAKKLGLESFELYIQKSYRLSIEVFHHEIGNYTVADSIVLAARGIYEGKMGYAYSELNDKTTPLFLAEQVRENAKCISSSEVPEIFKGSAHYKKKKTYDPRLEEVSTESKIALLHEIETKLREQDERIIEVGGVTYEESVGEVTIINSHGLVLKHKSNDYVIVAEAVAKEGEEVKTGYKIHFGTSLDNFDIDAFAKAVAESTLKKLGGSPCESKQYPCVFNPKVFSSLLSCYLSSINAEEIQRHSSFLEGKLGYPVASKKLTVIENPLEKNVFFRYFDDEGVATFAKPLIEKGILKTYLYNLETARIDGVPSTGNGYKGSAKGKIGIRFNNVIVKEGKQSEEEIFSTISEGIYITEVQGLHAGMNKTSGNFSLQAAGFMIRDGKLAEPVNLITIAGNLLKVMEDIKALANNSETQLSSITCPSVYIKSIAVSGK